MKNFNKFFFHFIALCFFQLQISDCEGGERGEKREEEARISYCEEGFSSDVSMRSSEISSDDDSSDSDSEFFVTPNKKHMKQISSHEYEVSRKQFEQIFPPCYISHDRQDTVNRAVGLIKHSYSYYDVELGKRKSGGGVCGTGTIIHNDPKGIIVITAGHVVSTKDRKTRTNIKTTSIEFRLGYSFEKGCNVRLKSKEKSRELKTDIPAPAIVKLRGGKYNLIFNGADGVKCKQEIQNDLFKSFFDNHIGKRKERNVFINSESPIMNELLSVGHTIKENEGQSNILAVYRYDNKEGLIRFHNSQDVALIGLYLSGNEIPQEELNKFSLKLSNIEIKGQDLGIYHYPLGTTFEAQRYNQGKDVSEGNSEYNHNMPTLGGSSGAPLIFEDKVVGIHTSGKITDRLTKVYIKGYKGRKKGFSISSKNVFVPISSLGDNFLNVD